MTKTLSVALTAFVLFACDQPVAPTARTLKAPNGKSAAYITPSGDALAFRYCFTAWNDDGEYVECNLVVQTIDGLTTIGSEYTGDVYYDWHTWSPDGGSIAYVKGSNYSGNIAVMNVADGTIATLTSSGLDNSPDWSPDGTRIAFQRNDDAGQPDIYVMNASDGSNITRLTSGIGVQGGPSWSPDGSRIAFTCADDSGAFDICAINSDGTGLVHLTSGPERDVNPDFSPDGSQIAFARDNELRYLRLADGTVTAPTNTILISPMARPDWSPSGDRIAYWVPISGATTADRYYDAGVVVVNVDGSGVTYVSEGSGTGWRRNTSATSDTVPTPDTPPVAEFSSSCKSIQCYFFSSSTDDHGIVGYLWTYGDGYSDSYIDPGHNFPASGTYQVTLVVTDFKGQTSSVTHSVTVVEDKPPTASFTSSCLARACTFDSNGSTDDHAIAARYWTFGDGTSAINLVAPIHKYDYNGTYTVTLTVIDDQGQQTFLGRNVTVVDAAPVARFTYTCDNKAVCTFDGRTSTDDVGIVSYSWQFGGIGTGSGSGAVATAPFKHNSQQTITLTVMDTAGQKNSTSQVVKVR
jgi:Tol biopolymer transport system component